MSATTENQDGSIDQSKNDPETLPVTSLPPTRHQSIPEVPIVNTSHDARLEEDISLNRTKQRIHASLVSLKALGSRLRHISKNIESFDPGDKIKSVETVIHQHQIDFARLQTSLGASEPAIEDSGSEKGSSSDSEFLPPRRRKESGHRGSGWSMERRTPSPPTLPQRLRQFRSFSTTSTIWQGGLCVPKINYRPWREVVHTGRGNEYCAIDIPSNEPTALELLSTDVPDPQRQQRKPQNKCSSIPLGEHYLPERIRVNSSRLKRFILTSAEDARPYADRGGPLHILRPFTPLLELSEKLESHIFDLENTRRAKEDMSEHEYLAQLNNAKYEPILDGFSRGDANSPLASTREMTASILDLRCLREVIQKLLKPQIERISAMKDSVRFSELWYIFPEGSLIISKEPKVPQKIWKVIGRGGGRWKRHNASHKEESQVTDEFSLFHVECFCLDYDGERYIPIWQQFTISEFEDAQDIINLPVVPLNIAERDGSLFNRGIAQERGKQFIEFVSAGATHRFYSGRSLHLTPNGTKLTQLGREAPGNSALEYTERIDSEVIVDLARAVEEVPGWLPVEETYFEMPDASGEVLAVHESRRNGSIYNDTESNMKLTQSFLNTERRKWRQWNDGSCGPSGDDQLILPNRVFAFVLRSRKWACLPISHESQGTVLIQPVEPPPEPWNDLELPGGHKELVQSLIKSHFSQDATRKMHLDLVRDKGKGVIILLHGVPGVGKTSTAECVAQAYHRPLLPITCGDLGIHPNEVEWKLQEIFRLAHAWNCVLLLDEADIFLAQRTSTDIQRNALVSVFLRVLEYYEGILFLTTNRIGIFDEAFKSRIHMSLYYPPLEPVQTQRIWSSHIRKVKANGINIDEKEILDFAVQLWNTQRYPERGPVWNGRQIRNAFQSAIALAGYHAKPGEQLRLTRDDFRRIAIVSDQFSQYIFKTKINLTDSDIARMGALRHDDFVLNTAAQLGTSWEHSQVDPFLPPTRTHQQQRPSVNFGAGQSIPVQAVAQDLFSQTSHQTTAWPSTVQSQQQQQQQQQLFHQQQLSSAQTQTQPLAQSMFSTQQPGQTQAPFQSQQAYHQPRLPEGSVSTGYEQQAPRSFAQQPEFGFMQQRVAQDQVSGNPILQGSSNTSQWATP